MGLLEMLRLFAAAGSHCRVNRCLIAGYLVKLASPGLEPVRDFLRVDHLGMQ